MSGKELAKKELKELVKERVSKERVRQGKS